MNPLAEALYKEAKSLRQKADEMDRLASSIDLNPKTILCEAQCDIIITTVAPLYGITSDIIRGKSRHGTVVEARFICAYAMRTLLSMTFQEIASALRRDAHQTIIHSVLNVKNRISNDAKFAARLEKAMLLVKEVIGYGQKAAA